MKNQRDNEQSEPKNVYLKNLYPAENEKLSNEKIKQILENRLTNLNLQLGNMQFEVDEIKELLEQLKS